MNRPTSGASGGSMVTGSGAEEQDCKCAPCPPSNPTNSSGTNSSGTNSSGDFSTPDELTENTPGPTTGSGPEDETYYYDDEGGNEPSSPVCKECEQAYSLLEVESCDVGDVIASVSPGSGKLKMSMRVAATGAVGSGSWGEKLNYLAGNNVDDIVGKGVTYTQFSRMTAFKSGDVQLARAQNTKHRFKYDPATQTYSSQGNKTSSKLIRRNAGTKDETYTLKTANGTVTTFSGYNTNVLTSGRLKTYTDRTGNTQTFNWTPVGRKVLLSSVTDSYNRQVNYRYYGSEKGFRLGEIEDFLGRRSNFQYDNSGHLTAVVLASVNQAAEGNTFPGGMAYVYQYDVTNPRPERRNDLIRVWYPNQVQPYLNPQTRTVNVDQVYNANWIAKPRMAFQYGQDPTDEDHYGKVVRQTIGDSENGVGGDYNFVYISNPADLPSNLIDPTDPIVSRTVVTDRNGNQSIYDFNENGMAVRVEVIATRMKNDLQATSFVTWTKYNEANQPLLIVYPEGNSVEYEYETGIVAGIGFFERRSGLLLRETQKPGNAIGIPSRSGSNGQTELTRRYFYDPIYSRQCAVIERRGNPIAPGSPPTYFTPQNGVDAPNGFPMPDDSDRSRYATITYFDYQKDTKGTVQNDGVLQELLFPDDDASTAATNIGLLIDHVNAQMTATDGTGGLPDGFQMALGDINGDGTGNGDGSGGSTPVPGALTATHLGNAIKILHPKVRLLTENTGGGDPWVWETQDRVELFTVNNKGQVTTHTDPEGNVTATLRYPENDPEGDGSFIADDKTNKQYGRTRSVHVDVDPFDVMSLIGEDGDLIDFKTDVYPRNQRTNTPGIYQNLVTRYEGGGGAGSGCASCAYDPLGNPLAMTDPRGFTWRYERNELGEVYRTFGPAPYEYQTETYYDANRNVIRVDTEDRTVQFLSSDPASPDYGKFAPSGSCDIANLPTTPGSGGAVRPGWFTNLYGYDLLDNKIEDDIDATGSVPASLVTTYTYDPNQNLITVTKPQGNIVEYDYDERDMRIATRVGYDDSDPDNIIAGSVSVNVYDKNGNLKESIGPAQRGGAGTSRTVVISDAFSSGQSLTHTGDWSLENTYDGFDRLIKTTDAVGNTGEATHDPDGRVIESIAKGPVSGPTPTNRNGTSNVPLASGNAFFDEAGRTYQSQQNVFIGLNTQLVRAITQIGGGLEANATTNNHTGTFALTNGSFQGLGPVTGSYILSRSVFDSASRLVISASDNTALTHYTYDGASRAISVTDALGNVVESTYDPNGNVVRSKSTQKCTITTPTVADEIFESAAWYDCLNRPIISAVQGADGLLDLDPLDAAALGGSSSTLFSFTGYDSRGNAVVSVDPKGNTAITEYDGAGRAIKSIQHLRKDGQGSSGPDNCQTFLPGTAGSIVTSSVYDGNSRVTQLIDDRGAVTAYTYDTLDRQLTMVFNDGSTRTSVYNAASNVITYTDENGSVFTSTFDPLGRKSACAITPASGVIGTTAQSFQYDGFSRLTFSRDTSGGVDADATFSFDSLGRVVEESQTYLGNTRTVTHEEWTSLVATGFTFPQGRQLDNTFDDLYRRTDVAEAGGSSIATWDFFGPSRVAEVELGNGLICTFMNNARTHSAVQSSVANPAWGDRDSDRLGYDGSGRMITKRFLAGGIDGGTGAYNDPESVVGFTTSFDLASNKLYERHLQAESRSHLYDPFSQIGGSYVPADGYDSLDRLRQYQRGTLDAVVGQNGEGGGEVDTPITLPGTEELRTYDLDGLGNWKKTNYTPVGDVNTTEQRQHNKLNQITRTKVDATLTGFTYDKSGNLLNDGVRLYEYDAFNRLLKVYKDPNGTPTIIGTYTYDVGGRRIRKVVSNNGLTGTVPNGTTDCLYTGWRSIEERDGSNNPTKQFIWGIFIDELVQQRNDPDGSPADQYMLSDMLYRSLAMTDDTGDITAVFDTDAYGNTLIFNAAGTGGDWFADDASQTATTSTPFLFVGGYYDSETALYLFRHRYYNSELGRFVGRDPLVASTDLATYQYALGSPLMFFDPYGLEASVQITLPAIKLGSTFQEGGEHRKNPAIKQANIRVFYELDSETCEISASRIALDENDYERKVMTPSDVSIRKFFTGQLGNSARIFKVTAGKPVNTVMIPIRLEAEYVRHATKKGAYSIKYRFVARQIIEATADVTLITILDKKPGVGERSETTSTYKELIRGREAYGPLESCGCFSIEKDVQKGKRKMYQNFNTVGTTGEASVSIGGVVSSELEIKPPIKWSPEASPL